MINLPQAGNAYAEERRGIGAVQSYAANREQIWRETNTGDVGIDGQIEFVTAEGFATGRMVAVQVKSGASYFAYPTATGWKFYPTEKHRRYWESFPLPVVIILHNSELGKSYWIDARQSLRTPGGEKAFIEVPAANILQETEPLVLFQNAGVLNKPFLPDLSAVLKDMIATTSGEGSFPLSYFDLFGQGLTNIARSIYFGTDVIIGAVEFNLAENNMPTGIGMGEPEHQFAFGFVQFLLAQNLAHIDYADCLIDWIDRQMQPHFVAPLTSRGRALVKLIHAEEDRLVAAGKLIDESNLHVAQEGFFEMLPISYMPRLPRIRRFQEAMNAEAL